jgi:hypothetical protein
MHGREDKVIRKNVLSDSPWVFYVKIIELISYAGQHQRVKKPDLSGWLAQPSFFLSPLTYVIHVTNAAVAVSLSPPSLEEWSGVFLKTEHVHKPCSCPRFAQTLNKLTKSTPGGKEGIIT